MLSAHRLLRSPTIKTWKKRGDHIQRGQTAIQVLVVRPGDTFIPPGSTDEYIEVVHEAANCFDVSQLAPNKKRTRLPFEHPVSGEALLAALGALNQQSGLPIHPETNPRRVLPILAQVVMYPLNEAAQELRLSIPIQTCHQEAATFVVAAHFGHGFPLTGNHLGGWNRDRTVFFDELEMIRRAALRTIDALYAVNAPASSHG